jgi:hypothetical protein
MPSKCKSQQKALLVQPGDESKTTVVTINPNSLSGDILGKGVILVTWPYPLTKDIIHAPNGRQYRLEMYVGDNSAIDGSELNPCATLTMDPLGEFKGNHVFGPALIHSIDKKHPDLTLDDWKNICQAVWYNEELVDKNARGKFRHQ